MIGSDIRYALRSLTRQKLATTMVVGMLAIGIAANVAVFSLVNGLFLRPFPFPEPERLVYINEKAPRWNLETTGINFADFHRWRQDQKLFEAIAIWDADSLNLSEGSSAERIPAAVVTYDFADVLRMRPVLGRMFTPDEDKPDAPYVALIGQALWHERFAASPDVLGRTIRLNGREHTIIGVLPAEADAYPGNTRLWIPLRGNPNQEGQSYSYNGLGRLKPGVSAEQAEEDLMRAHQAIWDARDKERVVSPFVQPLSEVLVRDFRSAASTLTAAVVLLLVVACANVAALMLARALARRREMGIRAAVGAGRLRLLRQLLFENLLMALAGGAVGVMLGQWAIQSLVAALPDEAPPWASFAVDTRVMSFALLLSIVTVLLFGWAPALHALTRDLRSAMHGVANAETTSRSGRRTLVALIGTEFALATVLLVCGGLLFRAYDRVRHVDPGFDTRGVVAFMVSLPHVSYPDAPARLAFWQRLEERMRAIPGVGQAGLVTCPPFGCHWGNFFRAEGAPPLRSDESNPVVLWRFATPHYANAMGLRLKAGRWLEDRDGAEGSPREGPQRDGVVVVNETFARTFWPGIESPVGRRIRPGSNPRPESPHFTVVGIVEDVRHYGLEQPMRPGVYLPLRRNPQSAMAIALRTSGDPSALIGSARAVLRELDPTLPMYRVQTMEQALRASTAVRATYSWMLAVFAIMGVALALGGTYGVSSYLVTQRTRELGIRMALGARRADIMRAVLRGSLATVAVGIAAGVAGALGVAQLLSNLLFGVPPHDGLILSTAVIVLLGTALAANLLPARRAARVDPTLSLRAE